MADYSKKFGDTVRVFSEEETAGFATVRQLFDAFMKIISQNNMFIEMVETAIKAPRSKRAAHVEKICHYFVPGNDYDRNFSHCALSDVRQFMFDHPQPGILQDFPMVWDVVKVVRNSTATLFNRLEKFEPTVELQEAKLAISKIFEYLLVSDPFYFASEKTFVVAVDRAFESFFHACEENVKVLRGKYLSGHAELKKMLKGVDEKADNMLFEATNHEHGKPPKDKRKMKEKAYAMVKEAEFLVLNKGYKKTAAAKDVVELHLHDRDGTPYGANQAEALRIALTRKLAHPSISRTKKICRG